MIMININNHNNTNDNDNDDTHTHKHTNDNNTSAASAAATGAIFQDSSKGGAVETGCSDLYDVKYYLSYNTTPIHCTPLRLHPPLMNTQYYIMSCCTV